ncbi:D-alanine--D-alanine ligase family protein [Chitinivibrio alkaliphilus]|uniref:D-alanine--D-alanine ligase n=1 Tax=Chitinivibrio alkaliphilus ACht1 TaxID=1313304 RepID=U7D9Z6_9BACT|nr:ATP-grasp domain-containing protein [Chitinivibrio alkaliphilus]ERP31250.1 D-alanine--D-alanine ligase [Chitinivibrio alkaliphilus ACht1]
MKKHVTIAMGGPSQEREISLQTGLEILRNLDRERYIPAVVLIDEKRQFYFAETGDAITEEDLHTPKESSRFRGPYSPRGAVSVWNNCDICFNALHGEFGEDGVFQGYLETIGVAYTGSAVSASALGMHKGLAKKIFEASGIPTPPYTLYRNEPEKIPHIAARHGFPCFVKCPQSGSSKLMGIAHTKEELHGLLEEYSQYAPSVLVETYIEGEEFSCPVMETAEGVQALPPVYIKPTEGTYFDYDAKYKGKSEEIVPVPHAPELVELLERTARAVHISLECSVYSRTDMIVHGGTPFVLEVNTLPGFTPASLLPKSYLSQGNSYTQLLTEIIEESFRRNSRR